MALPLVSVICLNYNQSAYVCQAIDSVLGQTYPHIELLVADDASTDGSAALIERYLQPHPAVRFVAFAQNQGNCRAFNTLAREAKGKYLIDLAADDVLLPERIARQVAFFEQQAPDVALVFSNAQLIDANGKLLRNYYAQGQHVPDGDMYAANIARNVICTPTIMLRADIFGKLGGYDESLSYEDYDYFARCSRQYRFAYQPEVLTQKRLLRQSHGQQFYQRQNRHLPSTLRVCHKIRALNRKKSEDAALAVSVRYHLRQAVLTDSFEVALAFGKLLKELQQRRFTDYAWLLAARLRLPLFGLFIWYRKRKNL